MKKTRKDGKATNEMAIALYARTTATTVRCIEEQLERAFAELRWQGLWDKSGHGEYRELFTAQPTDSPESDFDAHFFDQKTELVWPLPDRSDLARLFRAIELGEVQAIVTDYGPRIFGQGRSGVSEIRDFLRRHNIRIYDSYGCGKLQY